MGLDKTLLKKKGQPDAERGHYHEIGERKKGLSSTFYCFIVYFGLLLLMAALTNVGLHLAIQLVASKGGHPLILPLLNHVAAAASISLFVLVSVCLARKSGSGFLVVMFMAVCVLFLTLSVTTLTSLHVGKVIHECPHHLHHNNNKHHNTNSNIHHPHLPPHPHKPHHNKHNNDFLPIKVEQGEEEAEGNGILSTSFFRLETIVKLNNKHHLNDNNKNNKNKHEHEYLVRAGCWQMSWSQHMMLTASLGALAMMAVSTIGLLLIGSLAALQLLPYEEQEEQEEDDEEGVMAGRRNKDGYELLLTSDSS
ncbi:hypothetical protein QOT17_020536 [Balamuthia mandrillaris]